MQQTRMVRLATVGNSFHARVIAARLGADGIVTQLRGNFDGIYPVGEVHVFVAEDDLDDSAELLMVDEVESAFDDTVEGTEGGPRRELWILLGALVVMTSVLFARTF